MCELCGRGPCRTQITWSPAPGYRSFSSTVPTSRLLHSCRRESIASWLRVRCPAAEMHGFTPTSHSFDVRCFGADQGSHRQGQCGGRAARPARARLGLSAELPADSLAGSGFLCVADEVGVSVDGWPDVTDGPMTIRSVLHQWRDREEISHSLIRSRHAGRNELKARLRAHTTETFRGGGPNSLPLRLAACERRMLQA